MQFTSPKTLRTPMLIKLVLKFSRVLKNTCNVHGDVSDIVGKQLYLIRLTVERGSTNLQIKIPRSSQDPCNGN